MPSTSALMTEIEFDSALSVLLQKPLSVRYYGSTWDIDDCKQMAAMVCLREFRAGNVASQADLEKLYLKQVSGKAKSQYRKGLQAKRAAHATVSDDFTMHGVASDAESQVAATELVSLLVESLGCSDVIEDLLAGFTKKDTAKRNQISRRKLDGIIGQASRILGNVA